MLAWTTRGDGERVVIVLHGFLGSGRNLGSLARRLSERDRALKIVLPDLTGHGSSPPLPIGADLDLLAKDVLDLADQVAPRRPLEIAGHSLGGRVALALRLLRPDRVRSIELLDIGPSPIAFDRPELAPVLRALFSAPERGNARDDFDVALQKAGLRRPLIEWLMTNVVKDLATGEYAWRFDRDALAQLQRLTSSADLWRAIDGTISLVRGAQSTFVSDEDAARMTALGATVETIAGAGHFLHVDRADETTEAVARWLERA